MKRFADWFHFSVKGSIYVVLFLTILTLSGQLLLSFIERYQSSIEQNLSNAMHTPVRMERIKAHWFGLEPDITLTGLKIYHPTMPNTVLLVIDRVHIELALWQSLLAWDWRLDAQVSGINVHIAEQASGEWVIEEMMALGPSRPEVRKNALTWLLKQSEWQLANISVALHPYQQNTIQLDHLTLLNRNRGQRHYFRGTGQLNQQPFNVAANLSTSQSPAILASWQGQLYAQLPQQEWQSWFVPSLLPKGLDIQRLIMGGEVWAQLKDGQLHAVTTQLTIPNAEINYQQQAFAAEKITALLAWQQQSQGWEVSAQQLQGTINRQPIPLATVAVKRTGQTVEVAAREIVIAPLTGLIGGLNLPIAVKDWLAQAKPQGQLVSLGATLQLGVDVDNAPQLQALSGEFKQFSALSTANFAGCQHLNGWFAHHEQGGQANIEIVDGEVDLRQIYRVPTPVRQLNAKFKWSNLGDSWLLQSNDMTVANADAHGDAVVTLWWPKQDFSAAQMHLLASIYDGKLQSVWRYVPWPSAGDDTLVWLKSAFLEGAIERGDFLYEGVLIDKVGRPPSTMQMNFVVKNGKLAYAPDWPHLQQLNALVSINNRHLQVTADNSQIYESIIRHVDADIPDLNSPQLAIRADIDSTGDDLMRVFQETPLKKDAGRAADLLAIKGEIAGALRLNLPLASHSSEQINVNITADLPGNPVLLRQASEFDLWLSGVVNYQTGHGLTSQAMQGFFLSQPVNVKLQSVLDNGDVAAIQIQANGQITPSSLKPWLADLTHSMSGATHYQAALTVPMTDEPVHLAISSDLAGWMIDLPKPIGKKLEPLPLRYEMQLDSHQEQNAYLMLGQQLQSIFAIKEGKITRALVQIGEDKIGNLPKQGLWVAGHLSTLNVDDWLPWIRPQANNALSKNVDAALPELESFSVDVDKLSFAGYLLRDTRLGLEQEENQAWRLQVISNDLSGEALFPHNPQQAMTVNIQTLNLPFEKANTGGEQAHPADWVIPKTNIHIADLSLKAWPKFAHSAVDTQLTPTPKGIRLNQIKVKSPLFSVDGVLDWQWRGSENTSYTGQINMPNVANVFAVFDSTPVLNSQDSSVQLSLQWQGNPTMLGLTTLNGDVSLDLKKGRVLNLNRAVSVSRLLGVLDSDNFKRRLKFDFSDITQKGLAYDNIRFDAIINNGVMRNQLIFNSPSLTAQGQGTVNLITTDLEQYLDISVPISSAVPYAAALVAGPLVGGALVAAEAMLDTPLTKMTTMHYQVKGKWQSPTVERLKTPILPWRQWLKSTKSKTKKP